MSCNGANPSIGERCRPTYDACRGRCNVDEGHVDAPMDPEEECNARDLEPRHAVKDIWDEGRTHASIDLPGRRGTKKGRVTVLVARVSLLTSTATPPGGGPLEVPLVTSGPDVPITTSSPARESLLDESAVPAALAATPPWGVGEHGSAADGGVVSGEVGNHGGRGNDGGGDDGGSTRTGGT